MGGRDTSIGAGKVVGIGVTSLSDEFSPNLASMSWRAGALGSGVEVGAGRSTTAVGSDTTVRVGLSSCITARVGVGIVGVALGGSSVGVRPPI